MNSEHQSDLFKAVGRNSNEHQSSAEFRPRIGPADKSDQTKLEGDIAEDPSSPKHRRSEPDD